MTIWNRMLKALQLEAAKAADLRDIQRCYGEDFIDLALCWFSHPVGFGLRDRAEGDAGFFFPGPEMGGVVSGHGRDRHLPCYVTFQTSNCDKGFIGQLTLFRGQRPERPKEQSLVVHVLLYDAVATYREALDNCLRDAALSGHRFIHVVVGCDKPTEENPALKRVMGLTRGPTRKILDLKMWRQLELQNSPRYARRSRGIGRRPGIDGIWEDEILDRLSPHLGLR